MLSKHLGLQPDHRLHSVAVIQPDVDTWPFKKVAGLGAGDLGRLLHGYPIESNLYEPGSVTVRTSQAVHRFAVTDAVQLGMPASEQ